MDGSSPSPSPQQKTLQKPLVNNQIRVKEVRLIDQNDVQVGVVTREKAMALAQEQNLDLIMVTRKVNPPICKITDYGKYLYVLKKREKKPQKTGELKGIRLTFGISDHDLETRANQAKKFIDKNCKVRIEMKLRGRQKGSIDFAKAKVEEFLVKLKEQTPIKIENELKRQPRGRTMIISKA